MLPRGFYARAKRGYSIRYWIDSLTCLAPITSIYGSKSMGVSRCSQHMFCIRLFSCQGFGCLPTSAVCQCTSCMLLLLTNSIVILHYRERRLSHCCHATDGNVSGVYFINYGKCVCDTQNRLNCFLVEYLLFSEVFCTTRDSNDVYVYTYICPYMVGAF